MRLSSSKMNWWAIHTNLQVDVIVRLPHPWRGESRNQERFLAPSPDQPTRNDGIECSNHNPFLSTLRPKGLSHSKMKWSAMYKNWPLDVIVRLPNPRSGDIQNKETFLAPSAEKPTRNYDIEGSNHHPSLSNLRPKGLSHSKTKCWPIYTNLTMDVIITITHARWGDSQG